jgi:PTS system N-acetylglucosamine-specific IIC component
VILPSNEEGPAVKGKRAFFERTAASLIIPVTLLPLAAVLLAVGNQLGIEPLKAGGQALIQSWLPLFYACGVAIGFTEGDGMAVLAAAVSFLSMQSIAVAVAGDPGLNLGVLGGLAAGALSTWLFHRVKGWPLPEWLGLFAGKRMGPVAATVGGVMLGLVAGWVWPPVRSTILALGEWLAAAGPVGVFIYGAASRLLLPTGLHHILLQFVDNQLGGWVNPQSGGLVTGEYLRFLAGDPSAGQILSGFFLTLGFASMGAGFALVREARPTQRRRVAGMMGTAVLTAAVLGITEPVEFAFLFASPHLWAIHILLSGFASLVTYLLGIRAGGYALPMLLINAHQSERAWLLLPLGLVWAGLYFLAFTWVIRWKRPPVLGQVEEGDAHVEHTLAGAPSGGGSVLQATAAEPAKGLEEAARMLALLGGRTNLRRLDACMTRLRVEVVSRERVDEAGLRAFGAAGLMWDGPNLQVVLGTKAGLWKERLQAVLTSS